jgi:hypothetical protein
MKNWKLILTMGLAAVMMLAVTGCESDSVAPQDNTNVDASTAEQWSAQALEMIGAMAASVPAVSEGDFSGVGGVAKSVEEPTWDPEQMAWVMEATETFSEGDPVTSSGEMFVSVWIQFRNAEGPLPAPLGATEMEYRATSGMVLDSTEEGTTHIEFEFGTNMTVAYMDNGYGVDGTGQATVSARQTTDQGTQNMSFAVGYGMDLSMPFEGCPSGPAWVTAGQYRTDALYDGEGMVDWTMSGPNYEASGSDYVECAQGGMPQ